MKKLTPLLLATLLAVSTRLLAADPESSFGLAPSATPQLTPAPAGPGLGLIPDTVQPAEKPGKKDDDQAAKDRTAVAEDLMKRKVQMRQAQMKAERDPQLQALYSKAQTAHTDYEQRLLFADYATKFCDSIIKIDPTIKKEDIDALRTQYTSRYYQSHISPTVDPSTFQKKHN